MLARITVNILRPCAIIALILGILFWATVLPANEMWSGIHMLFGIIVVVCLWVLGISIGFAKNGGNLGLGIAALLLGLIELIFGASQGRAFAVTLPIQIIHLLLGLGVIGLGEAIAGRLRRQARAATVQQ